MNHVVEPVKILLVEDSEDDIVLIKEAFKDARLINLIDVARDGEEAMAYLHDPSRHQNGPLKLLILLDINMPKMNGFEVLDALRADPKLNHIPAIMLTVSDREEDVVKSFKKGASSYIRKPLTYERFQETIKQFELYWAVIASVPQHHW